MLRYKTYNPTTFLCKYLFKFRSFNLFSGQVIKFLETLEESARMKGREKQCPLIPCPLEWTLDIIPSVDLND